MIFPFNYYNGINLNWLQLKFEQSENAKNLVLFTIMITLSSWQWLWQSKVLEYNNNSRQSIHDINPNVEHLFSKLERYHKKIQQTNLVDGI